MNVQQYNNKYVGQTISLIEKHQTIDNKFHTYSEVDELDSIVQQIKQDAIHDGLEARFSPSGQARIMVLMPDVLFIYFDKNGKITKITKDK